MFHNVGLDSIRKRRYSIEFLRVILVFWMLLFLLQAKIFHKFNFVSLGFAGGMTIIVLLMGTGRKDPGPLMLKHH
ncbi:hypothetical protein A3850_016990 [Lewinella sp. 4G2]|nr:hypothetical protein A3850_016990 [Lewinella sp. 4G2]